MPDSFKSPKYTLIYVFRINDSAHADCLKVGMTSLDSDIADVRSLQPNASILNRAARRRINQYTQTAGIAYELLYTESTSFLKGNIIECFTDKIVHNVLLRSGIQRKKFKSTWKQGTEWFVTDLETVKRAIKAVKEGRKSLTTAEVTQEQSPVMFRPEQLEAIEKTKKQFKKGNQMLWNAKMRFGKTLSALQVVKDFDFRRTLILTHRPVVNDGWFDDFGKIFYDRADFAYGSKNKGDIQSSLETKAQHDECKYVYFASIQDLRGSERVGGNFDKNNEIFATAWECIIVDEAHEGTQTELGKAVIDELTKKEPKILRLSGTPFNLLDDFEEDEIYTWDYVMEQRAKVSWDKLHFGDPNPYASLPTMNIYTYDLGRLLHEYIDEDIAFNFREFFRVNHNGNFVHEKDVQAFLNLLTKEEKNNCYPFANEKYQNIFRHTLWIVPGVKEARALSALLQSHPIFQHFKIVNVAGDGDQDEESRDALKAVKQAIGENPDTTRTITLSCGRLTTGVSVEAWTAVFMLSGSYNTAASSYMQTIFRVQTPATINGRVKEQCYVFDFAPDRTLKVIAETAKISAKAGKTKGNDRQQLGEFLNFCPIISIEGSQMKQLNTEHMLQQLKRVYVERVVKHGFEDNYLYNDNMLRTLSEQEINDFAELKSKIGATKALPKSKDITVNDQGLTKEEYQEKEKLEKKKKKELTEEDKKRLEELKKRRELRDNAVSILRGISIRMPLLIYGAELKDENDNITIDNFEDLIDDASWNEFMPECEYKEIDVSGKERKFKRPLLRTDFRKFKKYYDPDVFTAAAKRIRSMAHTADKLSIEERIERITDIFNTFRNPDKETVLTPWRVVNLHVSNCFGGYTFFDKTFKDAIHEPRFVDRGDVTAETFDVSSHLLEINSKSGLYPLYLAYNIYRTRLRNTTTSPETLEKHLEIWDKTVAENIFVICKTPMAKAITRRTLLGFRKGKTNMWAPDDLINKIKNQPELFIKKVHDLVGKDMKIDAIIGNPPYQEEGESTRKSPIYHLFYDMAFKLSNRVSLITPGRYLFKAGQTPIDWMERMLSDSHFKVVDYFQKSNEIFSTVDIKGGVAIGYRDAKKDFGPIGFFSEFPELVSILRKVKLHPHYVHGEFADIVSSRGMYRFSDIFFKENPKAQIALKSGTGNMITSNSFNIYPEFFTENRPNDIGTYIQLFGRLGSTRLYRWIQSKYVLDNDYLKYYNVLVPEANGTGAIGEVLSTPVIGVPVIGHTDTFLSIGKFASAEEASACLKYVKSKFARCMLGTLKATQHNPKDTWANVPMQDFTTNSDIDWSKSIPKIDAQLYAKYGLSEEEIAFIESMIKPM